MLAYHGSMTTATAPAPLTTAGFAIVYMPHSGVAHLARPEDFNPGIFGTTRPLCGRSIMHGAVQLASVPSCYSKCSGCTAAARS